MKFLNSNYGYANFARGKSTRRSGSAGASPRNNPDPKVTKNSGGTSPTKPSAKNEGKRMGAYKKTDDMVSSTLSSRKGYNASSALTPAYGPQPLYGPQQKKGFLGSAKDKIEGKAQYYGAKGKNMLAKAGKFISRNKVGVGLAAAGALGAAGAGLALRKMRSDKGKKRGSYN